jgi:hypothetical protein
MTRSTARPRGSTGAPPTRRPSLGHTALQTVGRLGLRPFGPWPVDYGDGENTITLANRYINA